jgi:peptide/nickel transport system substrate-binding protein
MTPLRTRGRGSAIALVLLLSACSPATTSPSPGASGAVQPTDGQAAPGGDGTVTVALEGFGNERVDPRNSSSVAPFSYFLNTLAENRDGELIPDVAENWEQSADGLTWTFTIRDDVVFQNGEPLTAEDVAYSLSDTFSKEGIAEAVNDTVTSVARVTESIEADGNKVIVKHTRPLPHFAYLMSEYHGGLFPKAYFEEVGRDQFNKAPIGAGPFKVTEFRPGQDITMERHDQYFDAERMPQFKTLRYVQIPELATRVQALGSGEVDIIPADLTVRSQIESQGNQVVFGPEASFIEFQLVGCWLEEHPCHDRNVRMALDLALDKEALMSDLYGEAWTNTGHDWVSPNSIGYSEDLAPRPQDVAEAQRLLAEAGYPNGEGFPTMIINTSETSEVPRVPDFAQLVAQQWQENLGITTEVKLGDYGTQKDKRGAGEFNGQVFIRGNDARVDGGTFMTGRYGDKENEDHLTEDPAILQGVVDAQAAFRPEEQDAAYNEIYKKIRDEVYTIPTGSLAKVWGVSSRISGWQPYGLQERMNPIHTIVVNE